jgi:predicted nucleic acid-binding Zn ribbon protein
MNKFKVCRVCDFEWHVADGSKCPLCSPQEKEPKLQGGVFGTGKNSSAWATFFKALSLVLLVYVLWTFILNG